MNRPRVSEAPLSISLRWLGQEEKVSMTSLKVDLLIAALDEQASTGVGDEPPGTRLLALTLPGAGHLQVTRHGVSSSAR
jgi:hypothetical protein